MQHDSASISAEAPQVRFITRLSPEVYRKFEASLPRPFLDRNIGDSGCDAAFKLGIQYVLQALRMDLVTE